MKGEAGPVSEKGQKGEPGESGLRGPQGPPGIDGKYIQNLYTHNIEPDILTYFVKCNKIQILIW